MNILDLDMDFFMTSVSYHIPDNVSERLPEEDYGEYVWSETAVRTFLENNLGLSKERKILGRIVSGHNEALDFWKELINSNRLSTPFDVIHVDSHADLGLGYSSWLYICKTLLRYPVEQRSFHNRYTDSNGRIKKEQIGDYLLFAIAYRWINSLTYCANPCGEKNDYVIDTLKGFEEEMIWDYEVNNTIQLLYNPTDDFPNYGASAEEKEEFINNSVKEPEVPFKILPTVEGVNFDGEFDFAVIAQSPNYTPASADYMLDVFKDYIQEI